MHGIYCSLLLLSIFISFCFGHIWLSEVMLDITEEISVDYMHQKQEADFSQWPCCPPYLQWCKIVGYNVISGSFQSLILVNPIFCPWPDSSWTLSLFQESVNSCRMLMCSLLGIQLHFELACKPTDPNLSYSNISFYDSWYVWQNLSLNTTY